MKSANRWKSARSQGFLLVKRALCGILCAALFVPAARSAEKSASSKGSTTTATDGIPLRLVAEGAHDVTFTDKGGGVYEIVTTGSDPHLNAAPLKPDYDYGRNCVVAFECFAYQPIGAMQAFFGPPIGAKQRAEGEDFTTLEGWAPYAINLRTCPGFAEVKSAPTLYRLDFGRDAKKTLQIRNLRLRPPTAEEAAMKSQPEKDEAMMERDARLRAYLAREFPVKIVRVAVEKQQIEVRGTLGTEKSDGLFLCESPAWADIFEQPEPIFTASIKPGLPGKSDPSNFAITIPRFDGKRDRIYSRWFVGRGEGVACRPVSHGAWATDLSAAAKWSYEETIPTSKKGMGGIMYLPEMFPDLVALGVRHITVNISMSGLLTLQPAKDTVPFVSQGRTYHIKRAGMDRLDETLGFAYKNGIRVSAIILVPRLVADAKDALVFVHPDSRSPGKFSMANVVSREGFDAYAAFIEFLASRYCTPGAEHGRISNWIIHNEVQASLLWTNCGRKTAPLYMNDYVRSMRAVYATARQYNPRARVFVSFCKYWNQPKTGLGQFTGRELMELLVAHSRAEGNFEWGVAWHPYPLSHTDPTTVWNDNENRFSFDSPYISFKNIEVLDAWMKRPDMLYEGKVRAVMFSEQGVGTKDVSPESLRLQAAGVAYAWKKINALSCVEAFQYHRWIDALGGESACYGLWYFDNIKDLKTGHKKPSYDLYTKFDTPEEDAACRFALPIIGIKDFSELRYTRPIGEGK